MNKSERETTTEWTTPTLVEICIGLEINGYLPVELWSVNLSSAWREIRSGARLIRSGASIVFSVPRESVEVVAVIVAVAAGIREGREPMDRTRQREFAESLSNLKKRESTTDTGLTEEQAEHAAVVKNMQRLRALRLSRKTKAPSKQR
jgi:coenzyme PQQ precursor peptide PqqA